MPRKERLPWSMDRVALVTGSRKFEDKSYVWRVLDFHQPNLVVHGGATGVDTFADQWAYWNGVPRTIFAISEKQWQEFGKAEGGFRNADMVAFLYQLSCEMDPSKEPDWIRLGFEGIVFPGGPGTENMRRKLFDAGIPYWDYQDGREPLAGQEGKL